MRRKLAVILAADVAGYSRMVAEDEEDTLRRLSAAMALFREAIARFDGRVFNTAGDAVLAEFQSAVNAVRCAIEVQETLKVQNTAHPPARKLQFRIGLTIGDIVEENGDLLGDGVNIAARLEAMAPVGGLAVSRSVYDAVAQKIRAPFVDAGDQKLKNIPEPVRAYTLALADVPPSAPAINATRAERASSFDRYRLALGGGAVAVILLTATLWWRSGPTLEQAEPPKPATVASVAPPTADTPKPAASPPTRQTEPATQTVGPVAPVPPASSTPAPAVPAPSTVPIDRAKAEAEFEACRRASPADAIRLCQTVIAANTLDEWRLSEAYLALGKAQREADQPQEALAAYTRAISLRPTADAYVGRGIVNFDQRSFQSAVADFNEAINLAPSHGEAHNNKAWTIFKMGDAKTALPYADQAVKLLSTEAYVWDTRGHINEALGNRDAAVRDYRQAVALDPTHQSSRDGLKRLGATP